jgi:hypothetical protein
MPNIDAIEILTLPQDHEPDLNDELADQETVAEGFPKPTQPLIC